MARDTLAGLPELFQPGVRSVAFQVVDWPDQRVLSELGIKDPLELTGLYEGVPLTEKSITDPIPYPDMIWLFREPILAEWRARSHLDLRDLVAHVTIHELAHHFGWSDDDIAAIDPWWED
ncbi:MAG: metallopeptidase family protein [Pseudomonadota bacterium]